ncbi:hypothetical protein T484DRAFT_1748982 [Baffinella frigidus]|nr:hypothetical protein T484DRAFT_1748982 [Cryptophyta sp. CCMP2293]
MATGVKIDDGLISLKGDGEMLAYGQGETATVRKKDTKSNKIRLDAPAREEGNVEVPPPISMAESPFQAPNPRDEVPINKRGPESFEELLERELAKDALKQGAGGSSRQAQKGEFLKRGPSRSLPPDSKPRPPPSSSDASSHGSSSSIQV